MKKYPQLLIPVALLLMSLLGGCLRDQCQQVYTYYSFEPVYMSYADLRAAVKSEPARELKNPGKLYFKGSFIYISEINEGIHIIDNRNPSAPLPVAFIAIPGNRDLAIRGDVLYADSYVDLLALDISDPANVTVLKRVTDVFPADMHHPGLWADPSLGVAVDWVQTEITESFDCPRQGQDLALQGGPNMFFAGTETFNDVVAMAGSNGNTGNSGEITTGVGGSMARFTIVNNALYAVTPRELQLYDIGTLSDPQWAGSTPIGWEVETIFPFGDKLLIGSMSGMFIYDIANPWAPQQLGQFRHVRSCDPVVAEGDYAYVTLRGGTPCGGFTNQLDVLDIRKLTDPQLVRSYEMSNPYGLGIKDGILFVCDGDEGLKVYDAADPMKINENQLAHFPEIRAYDIIPLNGIALLIGKDGLYQYDIRDVSNIFELSVLPIVK